MNDQTIGAIRTLVQVLAGWLAAKLVMAGVDVDTVALEAVLTPIMTGLYRAAISALANRWPWLEWLNGWARTPSYEAG